MTARHYNHLFLLHSKINNTEYERKDFIKHLRENGMSLKEYYIKYYNARDLLTGEEIEYKDDVHYIHSLFLNRENMVKYLLNNRSEEQVVRCIQSRKNIKGLKYAPSTAEARTSILPTPALCAKIGVDYNKAVEKAGLIPRYNYAPEIEKDGGPLHILVDTREQSPLKLSCKTSTEKLDVGDYSCQSHFNGCFVERKSLEDFCGTMSQGYERFQREVGRAQELGFHLAVFVEEKLETISQINVANSHKFIKGSPEFYFARMRALCETYSNVQFVFVGGRYELSRIIPDIFRIKGGFSSLDLQFLYDNKKI